MESGLTTHQLSEELDQQKGGHVSAVLGGEVLNVAAHLAVARSDVAGATGAGAAVLAGIIRGFAWARRVAAADSAGWGEWLGQRRFPGSSCGY